RVSETEQMRVMKDVGNFVWVKKALCQDLIEHRFLKRTMKIALRYFLFFLLAVTVNQAANAARVDTVSTYSASMKKAIKAVVVTPDNYASESALPVVYLLHGYSGNYSDWIRQAKGFERAADLYGMIIVCPDGNNSWYWDSPIDPAYKYETYVSSELVNWIDS